MSAGYSIEVRALVLVAASCAAKPGALPHEPSSPGGVLLVSHSLTATTATIATPPHEMDAETIELRIEGDRATMTRRAERLVGDRWQATNVETTVGAARPSSSGWVLEFSWQHAISTDVVEVPASRLVLSCRRTSKRVHVADARPVDLCTRTSHWTATEEDLAGWWCADVEKRMFFAGGAFFAPAPGVELIDVACCPREADACDGGDGGLRRAR